VSWQYGLRFVCSTLSSSFQASFPGLIGGSEILVYKKSRDKHFQNMHTRATCCDDKKTFLRTRVYCPVNQPLQWQRGFPMLQGAGACKEFTFRTE
jgi:hypothetical protein